MTLSAKTLSRRDVLIAAPVAGSLPLLVACGAADPAGPATTSAPDTGSSSGGGSTSSGTDSGSGAATTLGPASDVPVGGGVIYPDEQVVVTQPEAGTYEGFSAVCTHQGCIVSKVAAGMIQCLCHNSMFSAADGSVVDGPASSPLPSVAVTVVDGQLTLG